MRRRRFLGGFAAGAAALGAPAIGHAQAVIRSERQSFRLATVARGLERPWAIAWLPDGRMLVTERPGQLRLIENGRLLPRALGGVPAVVASRQGGLLDVCLHPEFARNRVLYLTHSAPVEGGSVTRLTRAEFADTHLRDARPIFDALPATGGGLHFGSRAAFATDGTLFVTVGERYQMQRAQRLDDLAGKVVRLRDDGSVPPDNPFVGRPGARPEIFSFGHRNPQGLARHPATGAMWCVEHGPRGGDELNLLKPGANYGWPVLTHGVDYSGMRIGEGVSKPGMEDPLVHWTPSISPCGLAFCTSDALPGWKGSLFTGGLSSFHLFRLELDGARVVREERLLRDALDYIRDVRQGPDGLLYLATDSDDGAILRLEPA